MAADLAVVQTRPLAEIPMAALRVISHFPGSDPRLNSVLVKPKPGAADVVILRGASATEYAQATCHGFAEREIRLPVAAVRWIIRRHPEAEIVSVIEREIGVTLRSFSENGTICVSCIEGDDELSLDPPPLPADQAGLGLLFSRVLLGRILKAFEGCKALKFSPVALGMRVETEGPGWSAFAMLAGMETGAAAKEPDRE